MGESIAPLEFHRPSFAKAVGCHVQIDVCGEIASGKLHVILYPGCNLDLALKAGKQSFSELM